MNAPAAISDRTAIKLTAPQFLLLRGFGAFDEYWKAELLNGELWGVPADGDEEPESDATYPIKLTVDHYELLDRAGVRDADGSVAAVFLRDSKRQVAARRLPGGTYVTTASLEGEAIVRCLNGKEVSLGYITSGWHIRKTMRASDCRPSEPAFLNR